MKTAFKRLAMASVLLPGVACADAAFLARPDVQRYIDEQVASGRFNRPELEAVFANVELKPNILATMDRPSTSRPWYQFQASHVTPARINAGVAFWRANAGLLNRVENTYGVPASMVVAILGIETNYGQAAGTFRVVDALATLGFDYPRRAQYFRGELTELLQLSKEEHKNPLSFKGSFAGAMGWPQFMPSSFRKWAVDFDGDGQRDIWSDTADAAGSIAHYFQLHGWRPGDDILVPAEIVPGPEIDKLIADKFHLHYTVGELKAMGVAPQALVSDDVKAVLVPLEVAPGVTQYWLGLNNFYVITRYNKSTLYAKAAQELAQAIKERYLAAEAANATAASQ
jgi:membrane-bound lytic murein transglycosylase B